ncbi:MAG: nitroreductase family protein [Desulfovibrio sp.]|jgi:nitroreductase|nr:nitroreductase family protein [Desulfovibrio sp.]
MELRKVIMERRSIRKFTPQAVDRTLLESLLKQAFWAPSGMNRQPWKFVVFQGASMRRLLDFSAGIAETLDEAFHAHQFNDKMRNFVKGYFKNLGGASTAVAAFAKQMEDKREEFANLYSAAAMFYNFLLLAHEAGLAACWMTGYLNKEAEFMKMLDIGEYTLVGLTPVGYPDQTPPVPPRKHEDILWLN